MTFLVDEGQLFIYYLLLPRRDFSVIGLSRPGEVFSFLTLSCRVFASMVNERKVLFFLLFFFLSDGVYR